MIMLQNFHNYLIKQLFQVVKTNKDFMKLNKKFKRFNYCLIVKSPNANIEVLRVNATDMDTIKNGQQRFSMLKPITGFSIVETTGMITANSSQISKLPQNDIQFSVVATDSGLPTHQSVAAVRVQVISNNFAKPQFIQNQYR